MTDFVYTVKRTARRTLCVRICDDNSIVVSCPKKTTDTQIERFLQSKRGWIERNLVKNSQKNNVLADIINYEKVLVLGNAVPLIVGNNNDFSFEKVQVKSIACLKNLFVKNLGDNFMQLFNHVSALSSLKCKNVSFKSYKSRWGCCDANGVIVFNYKLLMLPEWIWQYVIVHELCHTVYMNHSKDFYALVAKWMPGYNAARRELKKYSRITRLY